MLFMFKVYVLIKLYIRVIPLINLLPILLPLLPRSLKYIRMIKD